MTCDPNPCNATCQWVFDRLTVSPVITGGTRVEWQLHPLFRDPQPYTFQLQVGHTANPEADDWEDSGLPVTDTFYAIDEDQRVYGKTQWTHYRVKMVTTVDTYYSAPQASLGALNRQAWLKWKNHLRVQLTALKQGPGSAKGYVLKRRLAGEACDCLDTQTNEVRKPQHLRCYGTGFVGGYYEPLGCQYADMALRMSKDRIEDQMRGMVNEVAVPSKLLAVPQLNELDIFIDQASDVRYTVRGIQYMAAQNNVPVVIQAKLVPIAFSHIVYQFPLS